MMKSSCNYKAINGGVCRCKVLVHILCWIVTTHVSYAKNLTTTFAGGNGQNGNLFDVVALRDVVIDGMDIHIDLIAGNTTTVRVFTKTGSYVGSEDDIRVWTKICDTQIESQGLGKSSSIPSQDFASVSIGGGNSQAFLVTLIGNTLEYTNGFNRSKIAASNSDIQILEGIGFEYDSASQIDFTLRTFPDQPPSSRIWNGILKYSLVTSAPTALIPEEPIDPRHGGENSIRLIAAVTSGASTFAILVLFLARKLVRRSKSEKILDSMEAKHAVFFEPHNRNFDTDVAPPSGTPSVASLRMSSQKLSSMKINYPYVLDEKWIVLWSPLYAAPFYVNQETGASQWDFPEEYQLNV